MGRSYEDVIQIIAKSKMTITPTIALGVYQAAVASDPSIAQDVRMTRLQPAWAQPGASGGGRGGRGGGATGPDAFRQTIQRSAKVLMDLLRAGVPLIAGGGAALVPYC